MKFLVVDDSKLARKMTIKSLKAVFFQEFEIIEASDGKEAVEYYKQNNPEITFMDLTMPVLNGFEATDQITDYDEDAQIVVVSADVQEDAVKKAQECGAIGFIKKPIDPDNLKNMLTQLELI